MNTSELRNGIKPQGRFRRWLAMVSKDLRVNKLVYMIAIPMLVFYIVFKYIPIAGVQIAFKNFKPVKGIWGSDWVGLDHFVRFVTGPYFWRLMRNTFLLSFYGLIFGFPAPIILALLLNEIRGSKFKRTVQTITYMPYFISLVVICGLIRMFTSTDGLISTLVGTLNGTGVAANLLINPANFRTIFIISGIWQNVGWGSILYLSAISSINQELYESAVIDGAGKFAQAIHVTIPSIAPTIIIRLILALGELLGVGFGKVFLLYTESTRTVADVVATYVYREGLVNLNYSYAAAVGLFMTVINLIFLLSSNAMARKFSETSLF